MSSVSRPSLRRNRVVCAAARGVAALPFASPFAESAEAFSHPAIMDATKAKQELGWLPQYSSLEALRNTLNSRQRQDARRRRVRR